MSICRPCYEIPRKPFNPRTPNLPIEGGGGGGFDDAYGGYGDESASGGYGDYTGGEMYNDYMANEYAPEAGATAAAGISSPLICVRPTFPLQGCPITRPFICRRTVYSPCITNPAYLPCQTRFIICRPTRILITPCRPTIAIHICWPTRVCEVHPGGGNLGGGFDDAYGGYGDYSSGDYGGGESASSGYGDYTGGEMFNDYMANEYAPEAGTTATAGISAPVLCRPTPLRGCPISRPLICRTIYPPCYTNPAVPPCRTRFNFPPCRTYPVYCRPTRTIAIHICWPTRVCEVHPGGGNFGAGYADPYGY